MFGILYQITKLKHVPDFPSVQYIIALSYTRRCLCLNRRSRSYLYMVQLAGFTVPEAVQDQNDRGLHISIEIEPAIVSMYATNLTLKTQVQ